MSSVLEDGRSYVAGRWVTGERELAVENPADETTAGTVTVTPLAEVRTAIERARSSFIFGPVLSVIGYDDLDHAVAMANDSRYGLSAQVYGADPAAAAAVGRRIRAGAVNVNASLFSAFAPGGGYKQSGLGRERGPDGIREFQELTHMVIGAL